MAGDRERGVGSRFGHYELRSLLGRGGMGEVYTAYDTVKDRTVALKLLPPELADDPAYQERFRREARTAARLQEPHIIPIHDFGEIDGTLFIDMRLVKGQDLKSVLATGGALQPEYAVRIVAQIASALDAAHADGLVHRDIKPANILVTPSGFAYLADFGIASRRADSRMTEEGSALGSLPYMAPERFGDAAAARQADVYALACVLFECLTGTKPFGGADMAAVVSAHLNSPPPSVRPYGVDPRFDAVLAQGLAKDPAQRFRTAGALGRAAESAWQSGGAASVSPDEQATGEMRTIPLRQESSGPVHPYPMPVAGATGTAPVDQTGSGTRTPARQDGGRGTRGLWTLAIILVIAAIVAVAVWLMNRPASQADPAPTGAMSTSSTQAAPTTQDAPQTTAAPPEPSGPTTGDPSSPTSTPAETIAPGTAYDWQGWLDPRGRCHVDDRAMLIAGSDSFRTVICETSAGRFYYRGYGRSGTDEGIEIDDPTRTGDGWEVTNKGTTYELEDRSITIIGPDGGTKSEAAHIWQSVS